MTGFDYGSGHSYAITIVTKDRRRVLAEPRLAECAVTALLGSADRAHVIVDAYCIMPDHLHVVVTAPAQSGASVPALVHRFKQATGHAHRQRSGDQLWQRSYYDHVLREDESLAAYVRYTVENPVRAGLCRTPAEWPYCGPQRALEAFDDADRSKDLSLQRRGSVPAFPIEARHHP